MVKMDKSITINRPVETVWNYLTNLENMPEWDRDVIQARKITPGPAGGGMIVEVVDVLIGRRTGRLELTEFVPCEKFVIRASVGPSTGNLVFTLKPDSQGTVVREVSEFELQGALKLIEPVFRLFGQKFSEGDFANLKRVMETNH